MEEKKEQQPHSVKSAERVLDLFELLSRFQAAGLEMERIIEALQIPRSSFYALIRMLIQRGYVSKPSEGVYKLGVRAFEIGCAYLSSLDVIDVARPVMKEIKNISKETVNISIFDQKSLEIIVAAREAGLNSLQFFSALGDRLPAHKTASGRIFLSRYRDQEVKQLYDGIIDEKDLAKLISQMGSIRQQGFAENNQESYQGVVILAAPIFDHTNSVVAAMNIGIPVQHLIQREKSQYVRLLQNAASYISNRMGTGNPSPIQDVTELRTVWETILR